MHKVLSLGDRTLRLEACFCSEFVADRHRILPSSICDGLSGPVRALSPTSAAKFSENGGRLLNVLPQNQQNKLFLSPPIFTPLTLRKRGCWTKVTGSDASSLDTLDRKDVPQWHTHKPPTPSRTSRRRDKQNGGRPSYSFTQTARRYARRCRRPSSRSRHATAAKGRRPRVPAYGPCPRGGDARPRW